MRDFRLDPEDIEGLALAYERLLEQPYVDAGRSGLLGTCVGGSMALMASADPRVRERVAFAAAFAPYGSLFTLARDIASATRESGGRLVPWSVDPLTRKVFVHSVTARLEPGEAQSLRDAFSGDSGGARPDGLSANAEAVRNLLAAGSMEEAEQALAALPPDIIDGLRRLSPLFCLAEIHAPLIAICHDRDDEVIPVGESRQMRSALAGRPGLHYTEFEMFQHADPTRRKLSPLQLVRQLTRFYRWLFAVFAQATK
jgi:dienelactone hydrolase